MNDTTTPNSQTGTDRKRSTLTFTCKTCDEAFALIAQHKTDSYWAHIICLSAGHIELHLRPLEEKDY